MTEVEKFYTSLLQDIKSEVHTVENGGAYEPVYTQYAIDLIAEAGETENAYQAYEEKWLGTPKQLKINGNAISDSMRLSICSLHYSTMKIKSLVCQKRISTRQKNELPIFSELPFTRIL
jgi:hypothetical protein